MLFDLCRLWIVGRCLSSFVVSVVCSLCVVGCWLSIGVICSLMPYFGVSFGGCRYLFVVCR